MIEISHQQAQRLIRQGTDSSSGGRRLPDEQWATLQAHLEHCQDCRAYARQRENTQRELARVLQLRWNPVDSSHPGLARQVIDIRQKVIQRRQRSKKFLLWLGIALALAAVLVVRGLFFSSPQEPVIITPIPEPTEFIPTPTVQGVFRGVLAFESRHPGNSEIFLLNSGPDGVELTNLTQTPADDISPSWSPDGEWIAFLSDRNTPAGEEPRFEVYIMHVAGSRLTRLTADPGLSWMGPLSWSHDGRWIAARASRLDEAGDTYIYLVPLDGTNPRTSGPRSIAFSRNASQPRMSPNINTIAFQSQQPEGRLVAYNFDTGWYATLNEEGLSVDGLHASGPFDWSMGGQRLVYLAEGPYNQDLPPQLLEESRSEIRVSPPIIESQNGTFSNYGAFTIESLPGLDKFRSVNWVPESLLVAMVQDGDGDSCWTILLKPVNRLDRRTREISGLCVEGSLSGENWLPLSGPEQAERWLVVRARRPGESNPSLYAVRFNSVLDNPDVPLFERIPVPEISDSTLPDHPIARPAGYRLAINPRAAVPSEKHIQPMPTEVLGDIDLIATVGLNGRQSLLRLDSGRGWTTLLAGRDITCPSFSPDGTQVAFLSYDFRTGAQINDVFIIDLGKNSPPRQLTSPRITAEGSSFTGATLRYGCPVWSPDGSHLASILIAPQRTYLAVIPVDGSHPPGYLAIETVSLATPPVWLGEDGSEKIALFYPDSLVDYARIVTVDLASDSNQNALEKLGQADVDTLLEFPDYKRATAMIVSPDGTQVALILARRDAVGSLQSQAYEFLTGEIDGELFAVPLSYYDEDQVQPNSLAWLPDGQIGLLHYRPLNRSEKAVLEIYDPTSGELKPLISLEDRVNSVAWSADGHWVFFTGESGLWVLSIQNNLAENPGPVRLLTDLSVGLDLR